MDSKFNVIHIKFYYRNSHPSIHMLSIGTFHTLSEAIGSLGCRHNSSIRSVLIGQLTELQLLSCSWTVNSAGQSSCHLYMAFQLLQNMASGHVKLKKGTGHVFYVATPSHATEIVVLAHLWSKLIRIYIFSNTTFCHFKKHKMAPLYQRLHTQINLVR